jgi:hypothetical protein
MEQGARRHHQVNTHVRHIAKTSGARTSGTRTSSARVYIHIKKVKAPISTLEHIVYIDGGGGCCGRVERVASMGTAVLAQDSLHVVVPRPSFVAKKA